MLPKITDLSLPQMESLAASTGEPGYRARQVFAWVYQRLATSFDEMSDLPAAFREKLAGKARLLSISPLDEKTGDAGDTIKTLFRLDDGKLIESVLMLYDETAGGRRRNTVCVSTQVGCAIGCPFCATGQQGFERNLTPGEIIEQVLYFQRLLGGRKEPALRVTNVVFMGMGEPLANYDALMRAIQVLNSKQGFGLAARHITISTSGLVPGIKRLAGEKLQVELAISLHAANNALRDTLVPLNKRYPLEKLLPAVKEFFAVSGRRPTFEYALFKGVNDSAAHARELAQLLKGMNCHVNLIAANETSDRHFAAPERDAVLRFQQTLTELGIPNTLRQSRGLDIDAACGQLKGRWKERAARQV